MSEFTLRGLSALNLQRTQIAEEIAYSVDKNLITLSKYTQGKQ